MDWEKLTDKELADRAESGFTGQGSLIETTRRLRKDIDTLNQGQKDLKFSVYQLAKPHWVLWATLVVGAIAAIAAVILLFRAP